jgi:ERF superfamily
MEDASGKIDDDTGEILSTSEAAIIAAKKRVEAEEAELLGSGKMMLDAALMAALKKIPAWVKSESEGEKRGNKAMKYASLKDILVAVRPHLHDQDIRIRQGIVRSYELNDGPGSKGRLVIIYTDLVHAPTGEVDRTLVEIPIMRMDAQAMGSALTYGKRYSLISALGLATDEADDDGESTVRRGITDTVAHSSDLVALLKEIATFKTAGYLEEWGRDREQTKRLEKLSDAERAVAKTTYDERLKTLFASPADVETPPAKKGGKT